MNSLPRSGSCIVGFHFAGALVSTFLYHHTWREIPPGSAGYSFGSTCRTTTPVLQLFPQHSSCCRHTGAVRSTNVICSRNVICSIHVIRNSELVLSIGVLHGLRIVSITRRFGNTGSICGNAPIRRAGLDGIPVLVVYAGYDCAFASIRASICRDFRWFTCSYLSVSL